MFKCTHFSIITKLLFLKKIASTPLQYSKVPRGVLVDQGLQRTKLEEGSQSHVKKTKKNPLSEFALFTEVYCIKQK